MANCIRLHIPLRGGGPRSLPRIGRGNVYAGTIWGAAVIGWAKLHSAGKALHCSALVRDTT